MRYSWFKFILHVHVVSVIIHDSDLEKFSIVYCPGLFIITLLKLMQQLSTICQQDWGSLPNIFLHVIWHYIKSVYVALEMSTEALTCKSTCI